MIASHTSPVCFYDGSQMLVMRVTILVIKSVVCSAVWFVFLCVGFTNGMLCWASFAFIRVLLADLASVSNPRLLSSLSPIHIFARLLLSLFHFQFQIIFGPQMPMWRRFKKLALLFCAASCPPRKLTFCVTPLTWIYETQAHSQVERDGDDGGGD